MRNILILLALGIFVACNNSAKTNVSNNSLENENKNADTIIYPGIYQTDLYLNLISDKKIGIVSNQTGVINNIHLVDTLLSLKQNVLKVFCPEHGFRGTADAGQTIETGIDEKTGIFITSLYGKNKKPTPEQLADLNVVIFDLQDVGVRFYTYISTLHYVMEACAESNIPLIVLDRPNPNAHYIDGAVLDTANYRSFIGMHPVPIVYGMTIGEYAQMINGEKWLRNGIQCKLTVIPCKNYTHNTKYSLPVKPSPNLPNDRAIELYPTLCFFEATTLSVGRGTDKQFQILGHPSLSVVEEASFTFTPMPNEGAKDPVLNGQLCYGFDLSENSSIFEWKNDRINISLIIAVYKLFPKNELFFKKTNSIELLSGYAEFRTQIENGISEEEIRKGWKQGIENFKTIRSKYLIYE
ncbi:MAG TPA: DUF1343 domain-containing protein [Bacteroidales bacterium]|mgnify:CR=1 FL=1|nr:DUF1343 domain-containing protein [Bacteroidales bacterium]